MDAFDMTEKITIGFSKSKKKFAIYAWLIMWVEKTNFSHVYIKWHSDSLERDIYYQASGTAVNFMAQHIFEKHHAPVHEIELNVTPEQKKLIVQFAMDNVGVPYGLKPAIGIALVKVAMLIGKKIRNPFADGIGTQFCSELGARIMGILGYDLEENYDSFGPGDLYKFILKNVI